MDENNCVGVEGNQGCLQQKAFSFAFVLLCRIISNDFQFDAFSTDVTAWYKCSTTEGRFTGP